jgi:hypothetical protein
LFWSAWFADKPTPTDFYIDFMDCHLGEGCTQDDAIADLLMLPATDPKRGSALDLLVSWRINMEIMNPVEHEERRILMALSQVYLEWEKQTRRSVPNLMSLPNT